MIRRKQASKAGSSFLSLVDSTGRSLRRSWQSRPKNQTLGHGHSASSSSSSSFWKYLGIVMCMIMIALARMILNVAPDSPKKPHQEQKLRSVTVTSNDVPTVVIAMNQATPKLPVVEVETTETKPAAAAVVVVDTKEKEERHENASPIAFHAKVVIIPPNQNATKQEISDSSTNPTAADVPNEKQPWHVTIAHEPRYDLLGSFVLPTILLYSVAQREHWELLILPFSGSQQHAILTELFAQKGNLTKDWGSGFQDASHRADYNPMELNEVSYHTMGFFPKVSKNQISRAHPWIQQTKIPTTEQELNQVCEEGNKQSNKNDKNCFILLSDNPNKISNYINRKGGIDLFFTPTFCQQLRAQFLIRNRHRLQQYGIKDAADTHVGGATKDFNVAVHIRRGDILNPERWIDQHVFANVAKYICQTNSDKNENIRTNIHVFSSGPNRDGNWSMMEALAQATTTVYGNDNSTTIAPICSNVYVHVDEVEFDTWTFMIAADALVISPSTFGYIPSLIRYDNVYFPRKFWHPVLSSFIIFDDTNGSIMAEK